MSPFPLGALSNRETEFRTQNVLALDERNKLRFTSFIRSDQTLPHEILAEIFWHCLRRRDVGVTYQVPDPTAAPLSLCCICRRWREVAISTPTLWSSLLLDIDQSKMVNSGFYQMWLSRARATPLTIYIQHRMEQHGPLEPIMSLLKTILGLSCQWQNIDLDIEEDLYHLVFPLASGNVPLLENLEITQSGDISLSHHEAPKLRKFSIYVHSEQNRVPWHQLTCLDILRDCPNLSQGSFIVRGDPSTLPTGASVLHHGCLQSLALGAIFEEDDITAYNPMPILSCLKIPGLQSFTMAFPGYSPAADISPLISFLSRSSTRLLSLGLACLPATKTDLIKCLQVTTALVSLKFEPTPLTSSMNAISVQLTGVPSFLPKLELLHIIFPGSISSSPYQIPRVTASTLVEMLSWRWNAVGITRLKSFQLAHSYGELRFQKAVLSDPEFRRLEAEGMELYIGDKQSIDYRCFVEGMD
ncbi:hypothetical protein C8R47DRAFT_1272802 [Mycena vitilis]|nr:hypothetical protein C8R47DRAFT_1272802 [Mycena vitilis]